MKKAFCRKEGVDPGVEKKGFIARGKIFISLLSYRTFDIEYKWKANELKSIRREAETRPNIVHSTNFTFINMRKGLLLPLLSLVLLFSCSTQEKKELEVTATAYNSLPGQTSGDPALAAWGDTLKPGIKAIAVSRDLIDSGLTYGTKVKIDGLPEKYTVMDKMHRRWTKKIDIYMGSIEKDAREWGKRTVTIQVLKKD